MTDIFVNKIFYIFKIIIKGIRFESPLCSDVLIFDYEGSRVLQETILYNIPHSVLFTRYETFYFSLPIVIRFIRNLIRFKLRDKSFGSITGNIYRLYLLSCIEHIKPKVVITWVDDSKSFHYVSRNYKHAEFYAVSNGFRYEYPVVIPENGYKMSMPNFICYGKFEVDLYKKYGHNIDHYHPVGPVIGSYFMTEKINVPISIKYDICLVSQCESTIIQGLVYPEIRNAITRLDEFLVRYLEEYNLSLCIAVRSKSRVEIEYFKSVYGEKAVFTEKESDWLATYGAMAESDTIVVFDSTAAVEAYSWGKKVLFSNFSGIDRFSIPVSDVCFVKDYNYNVFREKLTAIRNMRPQEYQEKTKDNRDYLVCFSIEHPAHNYVRNLILKALQC